MNHYLLHLKRGSRGSILPTLFAVCDCVQRVFYMVGTGRRNVIFAKKRLITNVKGGCVEHTVE